MAATRGRCEWLAIEWHEGKKQRNTTYNKKNTYARCLVLSHTTTLWSWHILLSIWHNCHWVNFCQILSHFLSHETSAKLGLDKVWLGIKQPKNTTPPVLKCKARYSFMLVFDIQLWPLLGYMDWECVNYIAGFVLQNSFILYVFITILWTYCENKL
jgi:hypothetical protein